jgi:multiple sugar transport system permease protein
MKRTVSSIALHVVLALGAVLTLIPLVWMVSASFMPTGEANRFPPRLLPSHPTAEHYVELFSHLNLARPFVNSLVVR